MKFDIAKKLRNEDEVQIKETGRVFTVLRAYVSDNEKQVLVECDDGNTYCHGEIE